MRIIKKISVKIANILDSFVLSGLKYKTQKIQQHNEKNIILIKIKGSLYKITNNDTKNPYLPIKRKR